MTSKVLMKLPTVPFPQGKKAPPDLVSLNDRNDGLVHVRHQGLNVDRVMQLEQNMKFLQEQHQATLVALHQEIESLRQRNRDLQFQLVFSKRAHCGVPSSPSSPEDNGNGFAKSKGSPICVNVTPLQVELLEKDLQDIKASLQEAKTHNQHLSDIIEQQKKRLDVSEDQKNHKIEVVDAAIQVGDPVQASLVVLLEESYAMVKRLHKENLDQKKEIASLRAASSSANNAGSSRGGRSRDGNSGHHSRGSPTSTTQEQNSRKFPPLPIPSYWHRRSPRYSTNRHDKQDHQTDAEPTVLPQLQNGSVKSAPEAASFESTSYRSREYRNYGRDGNNRKYRGQASRRDSNHHYYHSRDYKDRNAKDHARDAGDTGESSKDTDNHHRQ